MYVQADLFIGLLLLNCSRLLFAAKVEVKSLNCCEKKNKLFPPWQKFRNPGNLAKELFLLGFSVWCVDQRSLDIHMNSWMLICTKLNL